MECEVQCLRLHAPFLVVQVPLRAERGRKTKCGESGVVIAWGFIIIVECWGLYQCSLVKPYPIIRYCRVIR